MKLCLCSALVALGSLGWLGTGMSAPVAEEAPALDCRVTVERLDDVTCRITCVSDDGDVCSRIVRCDEQDCSPPDCKPSDCEPPPACEKTCP